MRIILCTAVFAAGCAIAAKDNGVETQYGDLLASSFTTDEGTSTTLEQESGRPIATMQWSRATGAAHITIAGVSVTSANIVASDLEPAAANELLHRIYDRIAAKAPAGQVRSGYVTCTETQVCDEWEMFGMSCVGCADVAADCSTRVAFACGQ